MLLERAGCWQEEGPWSGKGALPPWAMRLLRGELPTPGLFILLQGCPCGRYRKYFATLPK